MINLDIELKQDLQRTQELLGPLPDSISLERLASHTQNLHKVALLVILEMCREEKSYTFLQRFHDRVLAEKSFEEFAAEKRLLQNNQPDGSATISEFPGFSD